MFNSYQTQKTPIIFEEVKDFIEFLKYNLGIINCAEFTQRREVESKYNQLLKSKLSKQTQMKKNLL